MASLGSAERGLVYIRSLLGGSSCPWLGEAAVRSSPDGRPSLRDRIKERLKSQRGE